VRAKVTINENGLYKDRYELQIGAKCMTLNDVYYFIVLGLQFFIQMIYLLHLLYRWIAPGHTPSQHISVSTATKSKYQTK